MKNIFTAIVLFALALVLAPVVASANSCGPNVPTQDQFLTQAMGNGLKVYTLTDAAQVKLRTLINNVRSRHGAPLRTETSKFFFASIAVNTTGVVFMDKGCVLPDSVLQIPSAGLASLFQAAGIKDDEIVEYRDA